jgi:hypothetical protein
VVLGEHDFEDDPAAYDVADPYAGGAAMASEPRGGYPARARESRAVAIAIGVFVAGVIVAALVIIVMLFSGGSGASSSDSPTQSSTVGTATKNTLVPVALSPQEAELAAQVSQGFRSSCVSAPGAIPNATAAITCVPGDGAAKVTYAQFSNPEALEAAYDQSLTRLGIGRSTGLSAPSEPCASRRVEEGPWSYSGAQDAPAVGRYVCGPLNKVSAITWTATSSNILATAVRDDLDLKSLGDWWLNSGGPYPPK